MDIGKVLPADLVIVSLVIREVVVTRFIFGTLRI